MDRRNHVTDTTPIITATTNKNNTVKLLKKELGLPEDATAEQMCDAIEALKNRSIKLEDDQVNTMLETYSAVIPNDAREDVRGLLLLNRAGTVRLLQHALEQVNKKTGRFAPHPIHLLNSARPVDKSLGVDLAAEQVVRIDAVNDAINALRNRDSSLSYEQARNKVRTLKPELFGLPPRPDA
jgi:hypothetical protein